MILRLNHFVSENAENFKELKYITSSSYPMQSSTYLNKVILLRFKDDRYPIINNRFDIAWTTVEDNIIRTNYPTLGPIKTSALLPGRTPAMCFFRAKTLDVLLDTSVFSPNSFYYELEDLGTRTFFVIVRWDAVEPNKVIMMGINGEVIVSDTTTIGSLLFPSGYTSKYSKDTSFFGTREEVILNTADTDTFLASYNKEHIFNLPIQDYNILGRTAYTEYYKDIFSLTKADNKITQTVEASKSDIIKEILYHDKDRDLYPDANLLSYNIFYDKHYQDFVDFPRRSVNSGIIVRKDNGSDDLDTIVVAETTDKGTRFITGTEAFLYVDSESINLIESEYSNLSYLANTTLCGGNA